jgi:MFS family permease
MGGKMAGIAMLAIAYVLSQFYRSFLAVLTPNLIADIAATKSDLSFASGAWFAAFALMQFLVGVGLDRYGPRWTASLLLLFGGAGGAAVFAAASAPWMLTLAMVLIGIGCSPVLMASFFIFARTFSAARFAFLGSWFVGIGTAGNVIGTTPLAAAAETFGWRPVMGMLAMITGLVAIVIFAVLRDPKSPESKDTDSAGFSGYFELLRIRHLWPIIPLTAVNYAPAAGIRGLWAGPFLADVHGADAISIGNVTFFMAIAMVIGSFVYGPLDSFFNTRKRVVAIGNALALGALCLLFLYPAADVAIVATLLFVVGLAGMSYGVLMAHARSFFPVHLTGRGVTLMNFFTIGGVGIMQFLSGGIVSHSAAGDAPAVQYSHVFAFYGLMLAGSLAIYIFSRDAKPRQ